ncbi:hypothetical protein [Nesterenkonia populi]|uniref:hypothetical protein n=1 Tax=Nesterenkonia populi TaxID=1591087 RepID=UPI0011BE4A33|nr:hypothetical protein [Nesterenkonia populi]
MMGFVEYLFGWTLLLSNGISIGDAADSAVDNITSELSSVVPTALTVGAALLAVFIGWNVLRRLVKSSG